MPDTRATAHESWSGHSAEKGFNVSFQLRLPVGPLRRACFSAVLSILLCIIPGCGYRLAGGQLGIGEGRTLAIPVFVNQTTSYRVEQHLTEAVRREFIRRTRFRVLPAAQGNLVLRGEVLSLDAIPIIFTEQGLASAYSVAVGLKVELIDADTGRMIFGNDYWIFREVFELSRNSEEFVPEETAALQRLARRFASALVASVLNSRR